MQIFPVCLRARTPIVVVIIIMEVLFISNVISLITSVLRTLQNGNKDSHLFHHYALVSGRGNTRLAQHSHVYYDNDSEFSDEWIGV